MFYSLRVGQLSFYSAEASAPRLADLAGVLCGPGQAIGFGAGTAARLTVAGRPAVARCRARRRVRRAGCRRHGEHRRRTAGRSSAQPSARIWSAWPGAWQGDADTSGATKVGPGAIRGRRSYPATVGAGRRTVVGVGLSARARPGQPPDPPAHWWSRWSGPGCRWRWWTTVDRPLRVPGGRRLARLVELVGEAPPGVPGHDWPAVAGNREAHTAVRVKKSVDGVT